MKLKNDFLDALLKEMELRQDYLENEQIRTIYFGGGTPSLLSASDLDRILSTLHKYYTIAPDAEITLEANPDDIGQRQPKSWLSLGINRLSIGVQSFFDDDLKWMNRAHNAAQANECILIAQDAGLNNLSIDLIYGTPGLSDCNWEKNMQKAVGFTIPHLSCYALTVEPGTALDAMIRKKTSAAVSQDVQARQFLMMTDLLRGSGYEHYEISNFSLPDKKSKHNSAYWQGDKYLGLGPSAHSFNGQSRQWNIANNSLYIQSLKNNLASFETEVLTPQQKFNEYVMTSVRTSEGMNLHHALALAGPAHQQHLLKYRNNFIEKGWIADSDDRMILTREGKLFADHIASEMFIV